MRIKEFRVRPVTRYIVTEFTQDGESQSSEVVGEFESAGKAERVASDLVRAIAADVRTENSLEHVDRLFTHEGRVWKRENGAWCEDRQMSGNPAAQARMVPRAAGNGG